LTKTYPNSPFAGEATVRAKALEMKTTPSAPVGATGAAPQGASSETKK
jgi:hypothetical protein